MSHPAIFSPENAPADGQTLATEAIQAAIDRCSNAGGGTVLLPAGTWLTGTLELRSNLTLHLAAGATLLGSPRSEDWRSCGFRHEEWGETTTLLYALGARNVHIAGQGTIDLRGRSFMHWDQVKTGETFEPEIADQMDDRMRKQATVVGHEDRPRQPIFFESCQRMSVSDIEIKDAPTWGLTFSRCRDVKIRGLSIDSHLQAPNSDGIHLCSCQDAIIADCVISCGDDCIAITGITAPDVVTERILVSRCTLRSASSGVRIGHLYGKVRGVILHQLAMHGCNRGVGIFAGDDGWVENVDASDLHIGTQLTAGHWWGNGEPLVISAADTDTGRIEGIRLRHVRAESENGVVIMGTDGNITGVTLEDWTIRLAYGPARPLLGQVIDLQPAKPRKAPDAEKSIPWLMVREAEEVTCRRVQHGRARGETRAFSTQHALGPETDLGLEEVSELE